MSVGPLGDDPGRFPDRTSLHEEGAGDITPARLLESVTRHLLHWTARWLEEGLGPVRAAWNPRCFRLGEAGELALADRRVAGGGQGLDAGGAFVVGDHRLELSECRASGCGRGRRP